MNSFHTNPEDRDMLVAINRFNSQSGFITCKAVFEDGSKLIISESDALSLSERHSVSITDVSSWEAA